MVMGVSLGGKHTRVNTALLLGLVQSVEWVMTQVHARVLTSQRSADHCSKYT